MKQTILHIRFFILNAMLVGCTSASAQTTFWVPVTGIPSSYKINSITGTSNSILIAGTIGGIYRSYDGGSTWTFSYYSMSGRNVLTVFYDPRVGLFAGTQPWAYGSTDDGATWSPVIGLPRAVPPPPLNSFVCDYNGRLFAGTGSGIYRSSDGGITWALIVSGLTSLQVTSLCADSNRAIFAGTSDGGLFRSTDGGSTWTHMPEPDSSVNSLVVSNGGCMFACTSSGVYRSSDNGGSWTASPFTRVNSLVASRNGIVFVGAQEDSVPENVRIYRSTDNGVSWDALSLADTLMPVLISSNLPDTVFAQANDGSLYRSTDNGTTWKRIMNYLPNPSITSLVTKPDGTVFACGYNGCFRSTDQGTIWTDASPRFSPSSPAIQVLSAISIGNVLYAGSSGPFLYRSTDDGTSWATLSVASRVNTFAIDPYGYLYAGTYGGGITKTSDDGRTWVPVNNGLANVNAMSVYTLYASSDTNMFAGTNQGFYKYSYQADYWSEIESVPYPVTALISDPADSLVLAGTYLGGVFRSTDDGMTWGQSDSGLTNLDMRALARTLKGAYVAATGSGVFCSTDNGRSWFGAYSGIYNTVMSSLAVAPDGYVYAGTWGSGVMRSTPILMNLTTSDTESVSPPGEFSLYQNYPNPFNPTTRIEFDISRQSQVILNLYDILGRRVRTLMNAVKLPGHYYVILNARGLASGVYFYRLQAGNYSVTKKLLVLK